MAKETFKECRAMVCNIDFIVRYFGVDRKKIASVMGMSVSIFYKRIAAPEDFRLEELERLTIWATKHGYPVTLAQLCHPFVPAKVEAPEVTA